jgi:colanic acid/amylovoran biosynthesis glycosyltransferase
MACWLPWGGAWISNQVVGALDRVEPYIVCDTSANLDQFPADELYESGRLPLLRDRALRRSGLQRHRSVLAEVVRVNRIHVLHSHFAQTGWQNSDFARREGIAHVVSCYGEDMTEVPTQSRRWQRRYAEMFESIDLMLCEGPHMSSTVERLGCPPEKIRVHPLGVELDRIAFEPRRAPSGGRLRVLMAAAFREKKGLPYALRALGLLARDGVPLEATLVGDLRRGDDPRVKREILGAVEEFGIGDRVTFTGVLSHASLMEVAYEHDIFLSPSVTAASGDAEGGAPVSVIEMAASGMPVIGTTHCDIPFVLAEANRRLLVGERDPEGLARAVQRLLELDWQPLVTANRSHIEDQHDARRQAFELASFYRGLLA